EAYAERTRESSVKVRDGNVEELQQATSKGIGLRVFTAGRLGFAYGTDFSKDGLRGLAESAVSLAKGAAKDQFNELPRGRQLGRGPEGEYDPAIEDIDPAWKLRRAHAGRAQGQDAEGGDRLRAAAGGRLPRGTFRRRERRSGAQEEQLPGEAARQAHRLRAGDAGRRRDSRGRAGHPALRRRGRGL